MFFMFRFDDIPLIKLGRLLYIRVLESACKKSGVRRKFYYIWATLFHAYGI